MRLTAYFPTVFPDYTQPPANHVTLVLRTLPIALGMVPLATLALRTTAAKYLTCQANRPEVTKVALDLLRVGSHVRADPRLLPSHLPDTWPNGRA